MWFVERSLVDAVNETAPGWAEMVYMFWDEMHAYQLDSHPHGHPLWTWRHGLNRRGKPRRGEPSPKCFHIGGVGSSLCPHEHLREASTQLAPRSYSRAHAQLRTPAAGGGENFDAWAAASLTLGSAKYNVATLKWADALVRRIRQLIHCSATPTDICAYSVAISSSGHGGTYDRTSELSYAEHGPVSAEAAAESLLEATFKRTNTRIRNRKRDGIHRY